MNQVFEDMFTSARKFAGAAEKKTDELVELSRLKYRSVQLSSDLKGLYADLGSAVYSMVKAGYENSELMDALIEEIDEVSEELEQVRKGIAACKNMKACPACGVQNPKEANYCLKCGNPLGRKEAPPDGPKDGEAK